jgi:hypothetical protein
MSNYPRRIVVSTAFSSSPVPLWHATVDGQPELYGQGTTEADAVYDLYCAMQEREADDELQQQQQVQS